MELEKVFFNEKPVKILAALAKQDRVWYASTICKEIDCTYPHMVKLLGIFEKYGVITSEQHGRIKIIQLTEKGNYLAHDLEGILLLLQQLEGEKAEGQESMQKRQPTQAKEGKKIKEVPKTKEQAAEELKKALQLIQEVLPEEPEEDMVGGQEPRNN